MRIRIRRKPNKKSDPEWIERAYRAMLIERELETTKAHWLNMQIMPFEL